MKSILCNLKWWLGECKWNLYLFYLKLTNRGFYDEIFYKRIISPDQAYLEKKDREFWRKAKKGEVQ